MILSGQCNLIRLCFNIHYFVKCAYLLFINFGIENDFVTALNRTEQNLSEEQNNDRPQQTSGQSKWGINNIFEFFMFQQCINLNFYLCAGVCLIIAVLSAKKIKNGIRMLGSKIKILCFVMSNIFFLSLLSCVVTFKVT